ncbi:MAG TPA: PilZ domain-containing protein [Vicinamibacterales bacterium]|nr:PilZ domain-containing protein [Vicinamibacterales bacterium]
MSSLVVLIGAASNLPALRDRFSEEEVVSFADSDVLGALEAIMIRRPAIVALERDFAGGPRGQALIQRLRADPTMRAIEIQTVSTDGERIPATPPVGPPAPDEPGPLDSKGTRRAVRIPLREGLDALLEGHTVRLVDLSGYGAQITSTGVLRPNQRVRLSLVDERGSIRCVALVVWAAFELPRPPRTRPHYRAGLAFLDANREAVEAFADRHARRD